MNDNDLDLDLDLEQAARRFDVPTGDVDGVIHRGRRRRRRQHRLVGAATVLAVIAGTTIAVHLANGDEPSTSVASNDGGQVTAQLGDAGIHWEKKDASQPLGMSWTWLAPTSSGDTLYAVSTAPGEAPLNKVAPRAIWQSDDGIDWTLSSTTTDIYASDLAATPDQLYAVGTGPATAAVAGGHKVPAALVGRSPDGGEHWNTSTLPIDLGAIAAKSAAINVHPEDVAAGPAGTVAIVGIHADLDATKVLPAGVQTPNGWALSSTGIDVLGDGNPCGPGEESVDKSATPTDRVYVVACTDKSAEPPTEAATVTEKAASKGYAPQDARGVVAHYDWSQLGIDGDVLRAVLDEPMVFRAAPGKDEFQRVDTAVESGLESRTMYVQSSDNGFDLVSASTPITFDPTRNDASTLTVLHSDDGQTWTNAGAPLNSISWISAIGRLDGHLAVLGGNYDGATELAQLVNGNWQVTSLDALVGKGFIGIAAIGPLGVVLTYVDMRDRGDDTVDKAMRSGTTHLLASRDGTTWTSYDVGELAGNPDVQVLRATITGDRAVVAVSYPKLAGEQHARQAVLVGTPE